MKSERIVVIVDGDRFVIDENEGGQVQIRPSRAPLIMRDSSATVDVTRNGVTFSIEIRVES